MHHDFHALAYALDPEFHGHLESLNDECTVGIKNALKTIFAYRGKEKAKTALANALAQFNHYKCKEGNFEPEVGTGIMLPNSYAAGSGGACMRGAAYMRTCEPM